VDTVPPTLTSATITNGVLTVTGADATSGVAFTELQIDGGGGHWRPYALDGDSVEFDTSGFDAGDYYIKGLIVDLAGNSYRFTATLAVPEEGDEEIDDIAEDESFDIQIQRRIVGFQSPSLVSVHVPQPGESVWIGECVEVKAIFTNPAQRIQLMGPTTYQWHIDGDFFKEYNYDAWEGTVERIEENDLTFDSIAWYWWKVPPIYGNPSKVYCDITYIVNDIVHYNTPSTTFTVKAPTFTMAATWAPAPQNKLNTTIFPRWNQGPPNGPTTVWLDPGGINVEYEREKGQAVPDPWLTLGIIGGSLTPMPKNSINPAGDFISPRSGLRQDMGNPTGIRFDAAISNFNSPSDRFFFMQVITQCYEARHGFKTAQNGQVQESAWHVSLNTELIGSDLDFLFPNDAPEGSHYGRPFLDQIPETYNSVAYWNTFKTATTPLTLAVVDAPHFPLNTEKYSWFGAGNGFATYVMYIPSVKDIRSRAVPVKLCKWGTWMSAFQGGCTADDSTGNGLWTKDPYSLKYKHLLDPMAVPEWLGNDHLIYWNSAQITDYLNLPEF
jgi:hypothetical protein